MCMHACMCTHCPYACILSTAAVVWRLPRGHHVTEARGEPTTLKGSTLARPQSRGAEAAEGSRAALGWPCMCSVGVCHC